MPTIAAETFILFSSFPEGIQRLVFEEAFEESHRTAIHFTLVSHEVKSWIEPLIYQCINLSRHTYAKTERRQFRLFASAFREGFKPKDFYTRSVRRVFIDDLQKWNLAAEFLPLCSNLISLACWAQPSAVNEHILESILSPNALPLPALRRLSLYLEILPLSYRSFHHPIFRSLTHLDIDFAPTLSWGGFSSLSNLTCFNLDCIMFCLGEEKRIQNLAAQLEAIVQTIVPNLPPALRCFIILIPSTIIKHFVIDEGEEADVTSYIYAELLMGKHDERIVLGSSGGIPQSLSAYWTARKNFVHYIVPMPHELYAWTYLPRGQNDFWMEAEAIIMSRKQYLRSQNHQTA
ncbi:hypothetical protein P691DRAFT_811994 [Macrolepiota fuliginosa MF-IS2]|uniref:Uncharacterized protein n=1 Tax=Macrolepiota fuliginosa MF-IS2 TaxID=1400762 RepID=A0A9P6C356_9AGAR|nr:hypothetical protein P691DRAFT_811994 [Macrolepiota fuliginosa MF-IS2]